MVPTFKSRTSERTNILENFILVVNAPKKSNSSENKEEFHTHISSSAAFFTYGSDEFMFLFTFFALFAYSDS